MKKSKTFNFKGTVFNVVETTTDKIKKGDRFFINGKTFETATSDSLVNNGAWSVEFKDAGDTFFYGFQSNATPVKVYRK